VTIFNTLHRFTHRQGTLGFMPTSSWSFSSSILPDSAAKSLGTVKFKAQSKSSTLENNKIYQNISYNVNMQWPTHSHAHARHTNLLPVVCQGTLMQRAGPLDLEPVVDLLFKDPQLRKAQQKYEVCLKLGYSQFQWIIYLHIPL
jgi:hypothetical protein